PSADDRRALRQKDPSPLLNPFAEWLTEQGRTALPKSPLGQAIAYARSNWPALLQYTEHSPASLASQICAGAEAAAASFEGCGRGFGSFGDPAGLVLGHGSQDMQRKLTRRWHVAAGKLDSRFDQSGEEVDVTREPVEFSNDQRRLRPIRMCQ